MVRVEEDELTHYVKKHFRSDPNEQFHLFKLLTPHNVYESTEAASLLANDTSRYPLRKKR